MSRLLFAVAGGVGLALLLFWLLALLVAPPQENIEMLEMAMPLAMVEAPQAQDAPSEPAPQSEPLPEPPAEPSPAPEPSPLPDSQLTLPEPELADIDMPAMELDEPLPPLTEQPPEPQPEPEPEPAPDPAPEPTPEPAPEATPDAATALPAGDIASNDGETSEAADVPVDVGRVTPTSQVPPEYPSRAQRRGMEGFVELEFVIQRDGRVDPESIRVVSANPRNIFDKAALDAVRQWRFDTAERLRQARQRLEFQLR
ncbi:energy transducer TonB [Halomonas korlensis]|uniref:Protein TonB n=1 Tax=Halomonas korlensis TaxID=463301 RepID=A0A1I7KBR8_9GAMM|nr:energy transducer TonB [Halomonas korlensis]SFU94846.1 outer membrane transport energization protein TonB [Halomonas korlensis]